MPSRVRRAATRSRLLLWTCCGLMAAGPARGQTPPPSEASGAPIRVTSDSVAVDVVVTDKHNRYVKDLTIDDFVLTENGVEQKIRSLESSYAAPPDAVTPPGDAASGDEVRVGGLEAVVDRPSELNLVILLLDYATIQYSNQVYVREAAVDFIRERLRPTDLMAVFRVDSGLKFLQGFTGDKSELQEAVAAQSPQGSANAFDQAFLAESAERAENDVANLTSQIEGLGQAGTGSGQVAFQAQIIRSQLEKVQALEGLYYSQLSYSREQQSRPVIGAIRTIADGVRHIPGRKTLVLFSQGFAVPGSLEPALHNAVESANRSNLAIYSIDAGGLQPRYRDGESELYDISAGKPGDRVKAYGGLSLFDRAREVGSDQAESSLRFLANATGGFLIRNTNDFGSALEKIETEIRGRYLLTYQPSDQLFDGEFRSIEVKVKREGLAVRARKGYWAVPAGAAALSAEEYRSLVKPSATPIAAPLALQVQPAYFLGEAGDYDVLLTLEAGAKDFGLQSEGDKNFVHLRLFGMIEDSEGRPVLSFRGPSRVEVQPDTATADLRLRLQSGLRLRPGRYALTVRAEDPLSGRGVLHCGALSLPETDPSRASLSSLILAGGLAADPGEGNLTVDGYRILPAAGRRFSADDRLLFYLNLYRPGVDRDSVRLDLAVSLYKAGQRVGGMTETIRSKELEADPVPYLKVARYLDLRGLEPGRYLIRAELHDRVRDQRLATQTGFEIAGPGIR